MNRMALISSVVILLSLGAWLATRMLGPARSQSASPQTEGHPVSPPSRHSDPEPTEPAPPEPHPGEDAIARRHINQGNWHMEQYQYEAAIAEYNRAMTQDKRCVPLILPNRGYAYNSLGQYDRALNDFTTALRLHPDNEKAMLGRGMTLINLGRHHEAISEFDKALAKNPAYPNVLMMRGSARYRTGDRSGAASDWQLAKSHLTAETMNARHVGMRAWTCLLLGEDLAAIAAATDSLRLKPGNIGALVCRSLAHERLGELFHAQNDRREAESLNPGAAEREFEYYRPLLGNR